MSTVMLNVRMPQELKDTGDEVLSSYGISTSVAIRKFYEQLTTSQELPEWLKNSNSNKTDNKRQLLREIIGCAPLEENMSYKQLKYERLNKKNA